MNVARVQNLTNANGRPWANQINITFKTQDGEKLEILQSYNTPVVLVDRNHGSNHITLGDKWDYSATTTRAVCKFLENYTGSKWTKAEIKRALDDEIISIYDKATGKAPYWEIHNGCDDFFQDFFKN